MSQARTAAGHVNAAARDLSGAERHATHAAGQAAAVAHVATHELGAAAYGLKAAHAAAPEGVGDSAGRLECLWQRDQLPEAIRELVLGDQRLRKRHLLVNVLTAESGVRAPALPSKRRLLTEVMRSADGRSEPPRKATVGNLIAADVETVPDLAERQRLRVLANDRPGSLSHLVFQSP